MEGRTTAVHYLKVQLSPEAAAAMKSGKANAAIVIEHAGSPLRVEIGRATMARLAEDLAA
jgi:hypothetical protein